MKMPLTLIALLALSLTAVVAAQTSDERAIVKFLDDHNAEGIALLEKAVNINSGTQNHAGVKAVGALFRAEFDALGFTTTWVDGAAFGRAGHLVANHPGAGPRTLLIGHLDTVFEADSPFQKFERVDANTAKGPGIIDMKGGDVVIIQALKALKSVGALDRMNIIVVMTGDEEDGGRPLAQSRAALVDAAKGAQYAIGFENGDSNIAHAVSARRGIQSWELRVKSKTGHSSQVFTPEAGDGAIFTAARILSMFREQLGNQPHLTFNPGVIGGGTTAEYDSKTATVKSFGKTNVIAADTVVTGDMRALTVDQFTKTRAAMEAIVKSVQSATSTATITFGEGYPPLAPTPGNDALLAAFNKASEDLGLGTVTAVSPDRAGAADVSFVGGQVKNAIDAVGMKGGDDHSPAEHADLNSLAIQAKRAAVTLLRLNK
ncbi:MAG: M20/M25/M40 family metallo-hydrolase [Acidobacteria bacterium]|nr:M20/M25/M40 family metallo-hydrolase [Acidobacteriota bacterium]